MPYSPPDAETTEKDSTSLAAARTTIEFETPRSPIG